MVSLHAGQQPAGRLTQLQQYAAQEGGYYTALLYCGGQLVRWEEVAGSGGGCHGEEALRQPCPDACLLPLAHTRGMRIRRATPSCSCRPLRVEQRVLFTTMRVLGPLWTVSLSLLWNC